MMRRTLLRAVAALTLPLLGAVAQAQWAPAKPITLVVPYPAGGSSDVLARVLGKSMGDVLKTPVVVDNRPGAGTYIGTSFVQHAPADGTTLYVVDVPFAVLPWVLSSARYDPVKDFTPVGLVGTAAQVFWGRAGQGQTLPGLIARAKAQPGKVALGTAGPGTSVHLLVEMLQQHTGTTTVVSHYRGSAPMFVDIANGTVEGGFSTYASAKPLLDAGKIAPLAVTSAQRQAAMPTVPTVTELGLAPLALEHWWGVVGPAGLPRPVVEKLNAALQTALADPANRAKLVALGVDPAGGAPEQFGQLVASEVKVWSKVARDANVKME
ncbi:MULTISPECIES: Bug family tripartite tricarboxylate transporter substrate binding protein [Ramlibacter]|uniref:Tripartite tricarboxylate transporter substrate binding protein n=1 Tax=Ramlibacter pinisoli TaxID=2682844 RepID=A0A6N8ITN5_9BURK|nr:MULTISPECIES: tripartite tricarboxylate transporter substrate-binding protein [Ramlibacter]MBA2965223.1 tripartite tricarboxylate transporter substrate binding protein [Ramlibacter sp. CGMCC 1.13660]MVQ30188.1 tripartite tricarboxylate transporter substrate binding protein [Ramlibacter pinisoli]